MYFYKKKGKQCMDLRGDFILSHNNILVKARVKSAAPSAARNGLYVVDIPTLRFRGKLKATMGAIAFIWGPSVALTSEMIEKDGL